MVGQSRFEKSQVVHSDWYRALSRYEKSNTGKAVWQLLNTFVPYIALWGFMIHQVRSAVPLWQLLPPALIASGLLVRIFIFFHDCGHGSFFASRTLNRVVGYVCGILTFTPYEEWRLAHAGHHAHAADLERRGEGDIWTLTVEEYQAASKFRRLLYRLYRNPLVLFVIGPPVMFLILNRIPHKGVHQRERMSVYITDVAIAGIIALAYYTIGLRAYFLIQVPVMSFAGIMGVWMFYVQHQYEGVYWAHHDEWDPVRAAMDGSSYYHLPKWLQWFTGNIGLHHIHHLRPRIPNYNLQRCYDEVPVMQDVPKITLFRSLRYLGLHLWDERKQDLISFRNLRRTLQKAERV